MKIVMTGAGTGDFREVGFYDFEDDDKVAYTGLLTQSEAGDLAADLRDIAYQLETWAREAKPDKRQILLPIFGIAA